MARTGRPWKNRWGYNSRFWDEFDCNVKSGMGHLEAYHRAIDDWRKWDNRMVFAGGQHDDEDGVNGFWEFTSDVPDPENVMIFNDLFGKVLKVLNEPEQRYLCLLVYKNDIAQYLNRENYEVFNDLVPEGVVNFNVGKQCDLLKLAGYGKGRNGARVVASIRSKAEALVLAS